MHDYLANILPMYRAGGAGLDLSLHHVGGVIGAVPSSLTILNAILMQSDGCRRLIEDGGDKMISPRVTV